MTREFEVKEIAGKKVIEVTITSTRKEIVDLDRWRHVKAELQNDLQQISADIQTCEDLLKNG